MRFEAGFLQFQIAEHAGFSRSGASAARSLFCLHKSSAFGRMTITGEKTPKTRRVRAALDVLVATAFELWGKWLA